MLLFGAGNCHACSLRPNSQVDLRCRRHRFLETLYLTYLKLTGADAFCPVGGGSCSKILDSDYAVVFGIPLALFGMAAYGLVAALGVQLASKNLRFGIEKSTAQVVLLGATTSMAAASAYFLYILTTRFSDSSCSYCLISAFLSFTLFYVTVKDIGLQEVSKQLGMQLLVASLVILSLNTSYSNSKSASSSLAENDLPYFATEITTPLSPFALSLAWHLHSIGAKMYGAFWCLHCQEQKERAKADDEWEQENVTRDEELERRKLVAQGQKTNRGKQQKLGETHKSNQKTEAKMKYLRLRITVEEMT
ncbi:hypothetical protein JHK87_001959 [Glycine soja]|nr:hypothetical protein JHK87_001959 [Glycine soja]